MSHLYHSAHPLEKNCLSWHVDPYSAAASVIPWAFFEESMTPIQMYRTIQ